MSENNSTNTSRTDWERLRAMADDQVDTSDIPPLDDDFFARATFRAPQGKVPVLLSIDEEVAEWFKAQDGDFRSNINLALRQYADSHR